MQTAKVGIAEIRNRAKQLGYSVSYCMFDKRPMAILHRGIIKEGLQCGITQNFRKVNGQLELCMNDGDVIKWSQFIIKEINKNKYKEYNLYDVV